ncbi:hypothetical protein [Sphingomonas sp. DT-204]|uniref:hypothetical protein n=1 Tax=Sphingomonas sp. DT-204 TaxID=3396166 RepID=UPI003F1D7B45
MCFRFVSWMGVAFLLVGGASPALADPTEIEVRVLARGAKFLGGYQAPVRVILTDADTGEVLAQGLTSGTTGDTQRILSRGDDSGGRLSTPDSAVFRATLDLDRPQRVTASVTGPLSQPQAATTATSTQWILPGRNLTAKDGWLLELPGLIVDVTTPAAYQSVTAGTVVPLRVSVTMLCGCPISPDGPWRVSDTGVEAFVEVDGAPPRRLTLDFDAATSMFGASIQTERPGLHEVEIRAWMGPSNNAGVSRVAFFVR